MNAFRSPSARAAAEVLARTPPGAWAETLQAEQRYIEVASRWVGAAEKARLVTSPSIFEALNIIRREGGELHPDRR